MRYKVYTHKIKIVHYIIDSEDEESAKQMARKFVLHETRQLPKFAFKRNYVKIKKIQELKHDTEKTN
tara:strand:+ start:623 stop:823 length:201 start_codon:yes stop_codon:yes gene_type:complete